MIDAGKRATVPVVVNLDHGEELEDIEAALALGFTSVMFDGAKLPLEQNMAKSRLVKEMAHMAGASCEAELGVVGGGEDGSDTIEMRLTDVNQVKTFIEGTGVDALAVAIGNAHGPYVKEPDKSYRMLPSYMRTKRTNQIIMSYMKPLKKQYVQQ
jgi:fructose-bisphosphate aldolase class II